MNFHKDHALLFSVVFFGYVILSWIVGIGPAIWVQDHTHPLAGMEALTQLQREGLKVYISEGCVACHTQQVRPLEMDQVWGRPSTPGDYANVLPLDVWRPYAPAVLGSERTGPDLTNVGVRRSSDVWQYIHLYNPRAVMPDSIMPAFQWLFNIVDNPAAEDVIVPMPPAFAPKNGKVVASTRAKALVAYLLSLKQVSLQPTGSTEQGGSK